MNMKRSAALSGAAALGMAVAIIGVSVLSGTPVLSNLVRTVGPGTPGTLSVLLTDPPHVPAGVTAVYVTYSNLEVHVSEAGNQSGWTKVSSSGSINLLATVNISETLASVKVPTGDYNALRLNISSAEVTFNGNNYTAFVVNAKVFIPIVKGGIEVTNSKPSATIIDISPLVLNIGSTTTPEFLIRTTAVGLPVPSSEVTEEVEHKGFTFSLAGKDWWEHVNQNATANLKVTAAALSPNSLNVSVTGGSQSTSIRLVIVSPLVSTAGGESEDRMPSMLMGSAVFVVGSNGTLMPLRQFVASALSNGSEKFGEIRDAFVNSGQNLTAGSSATYIYSGQINLGFSFEGSFTRAVVSGQQYLITVIGTDALASQVVVAA